MDKKIRILIITGLLLGAVIVISWLQTRIAARPGSGLPKITEANISPEFPSPESLIGTVGLTGEISGQAVQGQTAGAAPAITSPRSTVGGITVAATQSPITGQAPNLRGGIGAAPSGQAPNPKGGIGAAAAPSSQATRQEAGQGNAMTINAPLSDEQILNIIKQENQKQQEIIRFNAERDATAAKVLRQVRAYESRGTQPLEPVSDDAPRAAPPHEIIQKIKTHQLTAH